MWEVGSGPDGTTEVCFVTKDLESGKVGACGNSTKSRADCSAHTQVVLGSGIAYVHKAKESKL